MSDDHLTRKTSIATQVQLPSPPPRPSPRPQVFPPSMDLFT